MILPPFTGANGLLPWALALVGCAPSTQHAMRETEVGGERDVPVVAASSPTKTTAPSDKPPAVGAAQAGRRPDTPGEAEGRRTLSAAFVRVGPDGFLTVELRDGRTLVLRNVVMGARDYCGERTVDGPASRSCGGYAEVAAARPGGGPVAADPAARPAPEPPQPASD